MDKEEEDILDALEDLVADGFVEEVVENGQVKYRLTDSGKALAQELSKDKLGLNRTITSLTSKKN